MKTITALIALVTITSSALGQSYDGRVNRYPSESYGVASKVVPATVVGLNPVRVDRPGVAGSVLGAMAGGVAANEGFRNKSDGARAVGTVAGALLGGLVGRSIERHARPAVHSVEVLIQIADGSVYSVVQVDNGLRDGQAVWVTKTSEGTYRVYPR